MSSSIKTVGFIGTGLMGLPMAKNILSKKFKLNVWNRTPGKTLELQKKGAKIFKDIKDLVQNSKVIISMLANDNVCKAILIKKIHPYLKKGQIVIDMSSTTQNTALEIGKALKKKRAIFLDAPVSGGTIEQKRERLRSWWVEKKKCLILLCHYLKVWEQQSTLEKLVVAKLQN